MENPTLKECILDGLLEVDNIKNTFIDKDKMDEDLDFVATFLAGWILGAIRYQTVDLELDKKGK